jgi:radical SAM protein with 4Fe4S-binding SPASM domain
MDGLVHVNPRGEVLPCSSWPESLGSLAKLPFKDIWFSERAAYFKRKRFAPARCKECGSFTACQGACPLYWAYAGEAELEEGATAPGAGDAPGAESAPSDAARRGREKEGS